MNATVPICMQCCDNCRFFCDWGDGLGRCRRLPPRIVGEMAALESQDCVVTTSLKRWKDRSAAVTEWSLQPTVLNEDWCGEWAHVCDCPECMAMENNDE